MVSATSALRNEILCLRWIYLTIHHPIIPSPRHDWLRHSRRGRIVNSTTPLTWILNLSHVGQEVADIFWRRGHREVRLWRSRHILSCFIRFIALESCSSHSLCGSILRWFPGSLFPHLWLRIFSIVGWRSLRDVDESVRRQALFFRVDSTPGVLSFFEYER